MDIHQTVTLVSSSLSNCAADLCNCLHFYPDSDQFVQKVIILSK